MKKRMRRRAIALLMTLCMMLSIVITKGGVAKAADTWLEFNGATKVEGDAYSVIYNLDGINWTVTVSSTDQIGWNWRVGTERPELADINIAAPITFTVTGPSDVVPPKINFGDGPENLSSEGTITKDFSAKVGAIGVDLAPASSDPPAGVFMSFDNPTPWAINASYADDNPIEVINDESSNPIGFSVVPGSRIKVIIDCINGEETINAEELRFDIVFNVGDEDERVLNLDDSSVNLILDNESHKIIVEFDVPSDAHNILAVMFGEDFGPEMNTFIVSYEKFDEDGNQIANVKWLDKNKDIEPFGEPWIPEEFGFEDGLETHELHFQITLPEWLQSVDEIYVEAEVGEDLYRSNLSAPDGPDMPLNISADGKFSIPVNAIYAWDPEKDDFATDESGNKIVIGYESFVINIRWWPVNNSGDPAIVDATKMYLYAYAENYDADPIISVDDIERLKENFVSELYDRFFEVTLFGEFGIEGSPERCKEQIGRKIKSFVLDGTVEAKNKSDVGETINRYKATIEWGVEEETGDLIVSEVYVYGLPGDGYNPGGSPSYIFGKILICTDYNYEAGKGTKFLIRHVRNDREDFSSYVEPDSEKAYDKNNDNGIVILEDHTNVVIGGYGSKTDVINDTENCFSVTQSIYPENSIKDKEEWSVYIRFMNPDSTYVVVHSEGEPYKHDGLGFNGFDSDPICETGDNLSTVIYIGDTTVTLSPLTLGGIDVTDIADVRLKDASLANGVKIDTTDLSNVKIEFLSNFYDSVTLIIEYDDGSTGEITLERVGLVIGAYYQMGEGFANMNYDCWDAPFSGPSYTYDYEAGEQILIMATYYHPTNYSTLSGDNNLNLVVNYSDGTTKIFDCTDEKHNFNGYSDGSSHGAVDTTTFIIDFIPALDNQAQNYKGGFDAIVVNGGYDDPNTFGGAQVGSGKGVHWNGDIRFY